MNIFIITSQEREEYKQKILHSAERIGVFLEQYIFGKSPLLAACAARFFFFVSWVITARLESNPFYY
jgi:hypothetical protein